MVRMTLTGEPFQEVARPLLELVQRVTGLETSFVTRIDWDDQVQDVVLSLNSADLTVEEGSQLPWVDSMCRWSFLSGRVATSDVPGDFSGSIGAEQLGMQTFLAVPILADDRVVGTVCGASQRVVGLPDETVDIVGLVAKALTLQFRAEVESARQRARADRAEVLALTDELTGLANRRAFTARLEEELARAGRHGSDISLVLIDVDEFKAVNDHNGHAAGDEVLSILGQVLRDRARTEDVAARLGGDEFALLLAETGADEATSVAERIEVSFLTATTAIGLPASISTGVSSNERSALRDLAADADRALYVRKQQRAAGPRGGSFATAP
jgi:diguanylate cyclase